MKTDKEKHDLKGSVKSVQVEQAEFKEQDGQLVENPWGYRYVLTFSREGHLIETMHRNPDGSTFRTISDYSDDGRLLRSRNYDSSGLVTGETLYIYDSEGKRISEQTLDKNGIDLARQVTYTYDSENRKTKTEILDFPENVGIGLAGHLVLDSRHAKRVETHYDNQEEPVQVMVYNAEGALVSRVEFERDTQGNVLQEAHYAGEIFPFSSCCSSEGCSAEEKVTLTEEQKAQIEAEIARMFPPGTVMTRMTYRYDQDGRLIESKISMGELQASSQTFAYDDRGQKTEECSYHNGQLTSKAILTYEYDEHSNWTEKLVSVQTPEGLPPPGMATPHNVTRRIITYY